MGMTDQQVVDRLGDLKLIAKDLSGHQKEVKAEHDSLRRRLHDGKTEGERWVATLKQTRTRTVDLTGLRDQVARFRPEWIDQFTYSRSSTVLTLKEKPDAEVSEVEILVLL